MPFVTRDETGQVVALHRERANGAGEYLPVEHPEVRRFMIQPAMDDRQRSELAQSDLDMIRVYEDLINILMSKKLVLLTDFPPAAQEKLLRRQKLRSAFNAIGEVLAPEDDGIL